MDAVRFQGILYVRRFYLIARKERRRHVVPLKGDPVWCTIYPWLLYPQQCFILHLQTLSIARKIQEVRVERNTIFSRPPGEIPPIGDDVTRERRENLKSTYPQCSRSNSLTSRVNNKMWRWGDSFLHRLRTAKCQKHSLCRNLLASGPCDQVSRDCNLLVDL